MWSDIAVNLIKAFEGCRLTAYPDPVSGGAPWTVGWGSTGPNIGPGVVWTQQQADDDLSARVQAIGAQIDNLVSITMTDNQKAALCSFVYNLGLHALQESTLLRLLNQGDVAGAAAQFPRWDMAGASVVQGLLNRRLAEQAVFNGG
jgi:lysozyme